MATTRNVTVGTSPTKLAEARPVHARSWLTVSVAQDAEATVYYAIGVPTVSASTGTPLYPGDLLTIENSGGTSKPATEEVWAVVASGTQAVIVAEGA